MNYGEKKIRGVFAFLICICIIIMTVPLPAKAAETPTETIRVGWYEDTYHITGEHGKRSGYAYEYEQTIAAYTGWTYEYVKGDWSELVEMLENGEIDMMAALSYTDERAEKMLFSELPMGEERYYLYADLEHSDISASDLSTLEDERIGVLAESVQATQFSDWESRHDVKTQHVNVDNFESAIDMLEKQEIDGVISTETPALVDVGMSAIVSIGGSDIYYGISQERPELKEKLDAAMRMMEHDKPFYADELYERYLSAQSVELLTEEEKNWVAEHGAIQIGYLNNDTGVSVFDPKSGEMSGAICDYVQYAVDCLGNQTLEFDLVGFDSREQQLQALKDGDIDLIFHVSQNPYAAEQNGFSLSDTVWTFNLAAITAKSRFDENAENRVAVPKSNITLKWYLSYNYPKWDIVEYDSEEAARDAVREGEADCFVAASNRVVKYLDDKKLYSVFLTKPGNSSFAVRRGDTILLSILNKTLKNMPVEVLSGAVSMYSSAPDKVTFKEMVRENLPIILVIVVTVFLVVLGIILRLLRKSKLAEAKAKEAMVQAEKANEAKTRFLNNMSHDIRTPINGIVGMLAIMRQSEENPERLYECMDKIDVSSKLLLSLVNDVLEMAKLETDSVVLNNESINLDQVCDEVTKTVVFQAEEAGIQVTGEHDDFTEVYVWSSALHLKKILMNLFTNSIKYNKPGGSIHVSMHTIERTDTSITCEFKIEDTGLGMSEDFIEHDLFTPFVQADNSPRSNYMGTGLGMPIVKQLVEKMGGTLTVESKLGEGSRFTIVLPFLLDTEPHETAEPEDGNTDIKGLHLLLAEDNELNREIAEFMLTENGAEVVIAVNGQEALQIFEGSEAGSFDAILMDIMMPELDGLAATEKIRALDHPDAKTIPIIAMTANAFAEDAQKCFEAGMNAHLAKPLDADKVMQTICRVTERTCFEKTTEEDA